MPFHRLLFTCGFEPFYFQLANMFSHSCRDVGYQDDLIIFSTQDEKSDYAQVVNVTKHPDNHLLKTGKECFFHRDIPVSFGYNKYEEPYDFFMIKTLPGNFVDKSKYDFILYFDPDCLIKENIDPLFNYNTIVTSYTSLSVFQGLKHCRKMITPEELEIAKTIKSAAGGSIGVPASMYDFYDEYRKNYIEFLRFRHDQPALVYTLFKHRDKYKPTNYTHEMLKSIWAHYWGHAGKKRKMIYEYQKRFH
jgi:hypothetical protein